MRPRRRSMPVRAAPAAGTSRSSSKATSALSPTVMRGAGREAQADGLAGLRGQAGAFAERHPDDRHRVGAVGQETARRAAHPEHVGRGRHGPQEIDGDVERPAGPEAPRIADAVQALQTTGQRRGSASSERHTADQGVARRDGVDVDVGRGHGAVRAGTAGCCGRRLRRPPETDEERSDRQPHDGRDLPARLAARGTTIAEGRKGPYWAGDATAARRPRSGGRAPRAAPPLAAAVLASAIVAGPSLAALAPPAPPPPLPPTLVRHLQAEGFSPPISAAIAAGQVVARGLPRRRTRRGGRHRRRSGSIGTGCLPRPLPRHRPLRARRRRRLGRPVQRAGRGRPISTATCCRRRTPSTSPAAPSTTATSTCRRRRSPACAASTGAAPAGGRD